MSNRDQCYCTSCKEHPLGFCVLKPATIRSHYRTDLERVNASKSTQTNDVTLLLSIENEFETYQKTDFHFDNLILHDPSPPVQSIAVVGNVVSSNDPENQVILQYQNWYDRNTSTLKDKASEPGHHGRKARRILDDITAYHSRICLKLLATVRNNQHPRSIVSTEAVLPSTLLESEIATGIQTYRLHSTEYSGINLSTVEDVPGNQVVHRSASTQLRWIADVCVEVSRQLELPPTRKKELLEGLEEHKRNVIADEECWQLQHKNPHSAYAAVITNSYKAILLFSPAVVLTALMVLSLRLFHHVSLSSLSDFLRLLRNLLSSFGYNPPSAEYLSHNPRLYESVLEVNIEEELFAICPRCASSYPLGDTGDPKIVTCTFRPTPTAIPCAEPLNSKKRGIVKPVSIFRYQKLDNWIRNFVSRPGIIDTIDQSWEKARVDTPELASDFWDGQFIRDLKGPDGNTLFSVMPNNESRLVFSLAVDWFNPYHNKIAGKTASVGVIVMTCLNLPPEERWKEENVYLVGILPGPAQQSQLNSILQPLVNALLHFWENGTHFVGIPGHEKPRLVRCALGQLICDLPAARKVTGLRGHSATYNCSVCLASRNTISDLSLTFRLVQDPTTARSRETHMEHAAKYKSTFDSEGKTFAEKLLKKSPAAVRWSVLNELPYWDPIKCTVIDSMHLVLLGLCQFHWRRFWSGDFIPKSAQKSHGQSRQSGHMGDEERVDRDFGGVSGHGPDVQPPVEGESNSEDSEDDMRTLDHAEPTGEPGFLTSEKLLKARLTWTYHEESDIAKLSIPQILCLLEENGGQIPASYSRKKELAELLIKHRHKFPTLPKKAVGQRKRPTTQVPASMQLNISNQPQPNRSPTEFLLKDSTPMRIPIITRASAKPPVTSFITRSELDELQADIDRIIVPTWFTKLQRTFGEKSYGKLKADEWRSLFSVYLPMTFLRLWAESSSKNHRLQLKAVLCLSILVQIVTSKSTSVATQSLYRQTIKLYLELITALEPGCPLVINHHLALHLPMFMTLHGPCHSHWAFPAERLIGKLQKILHNSKIAEIPSILFRTFTAGSIFKALYQQGVHAALLSRWRSEPWPRIPVETRVSLNPETLQKIEGIFGPTAIWATSMPKFTVDDTVYRASRGDGPNVDSNIGFISYSPSKVYAVGRITQIIRARTENGQHGEIVFLVRRYKTLPQSFSPYLWHNVMAHRALGLRIVGPELEEGLEIVPLHSLIGHVALSHFERHNSHAIMTIQLAKDMETRRRIPEEMDKC